jgi:DNA-binding LacI/PurR family transcriptional regulator
MAALTSKRYSIPGDVSVIGFDNLPASEFTNPPLSSITVSKSRIGQCAMQLMAWRLEDPGRPSEKILIGGRLVVRRSVGSINRESTEN